MKKRISIVLIIVVILFAIYFILFPAQIPNQPGGESLEPTIQPVETDKSTQTIPTEQQAEEDIRYEQMQAAYQKVEASRRVLKRRLGKIKSQTWNLKLSAEQAADINKDLTQVVILLKNPPQLGAFRDVEDIERELQKLNAAHQKLDEVEQQIASASDE